MRPLARVVAIGDEAWTLDLVRTESHIETRDLVTTWEPGQNSPLDKSVIRKGRDIGNVIVQRRTVDGALEGVAHDIPFAFAFKAFRQNGIIHTGEDG